MPFSHVSELDEPMNSTNLISTSDTWTSAGKILLNQATLFSLTLLIPCALQAETKTLVAAGTITVSREKGRAVFSNDGTPAIAPKALVEKALPSENGGVSTGSRDVNEYLTPQPRLMYWSNTEHRYKPVPHVTPMAMKAAKSAVAEVDGYRSLNPGASLNTGFIGSSPTPREVDEA